MHSYQEVIEKIESARRFGNLPGVEVAKKMLEMLGNPQKDLSYVHVAGTNGKGSVCAFLNSMLGRTGKKIGVFTSPHLIHFEERISIGNVKITKEDVTRLGNKLLDMDFGVSPTMFDYCLVMAVLYFVEQECDLVIMETGLGGRLDATNALGTPIIEVITKIGLEHMSILGESLTAIATEKAGIMKPNVPIVIESQEEEVMKVLSRVAEENHAPLTVVLPKHMHMIQAMKPALLGTYQYENGAAAMLAAKYILKQWGIEGNDANYAIEIGVQRVFWPGRMEILSKEPFLMVDGAHNKNGVTALKESLKALYPGEKFHFLMAVMADKNYEEMIDELAPIAIDFKTFTPESNRALQAEKLANCIKQKGIPVEKLKSLKDALFRLPKDTKTIAFGSLYFVGELLEQN